MKEHNYYHEAGSKPEIILFWVRDIVAVYKKETQVLIDSSDIDIYNIDRIDIVVVSDHGRGAFQFSMKILYIMNHGKRHDMIFKKDNGIILKIP